MTGREFRFACKLPREITHDRRLHDCANELHSFLRALEPLAPKLQVILIQLPPSFTPKDGKTALRKFLEQLPRDFRFAIEFRHPGWHRPQIIRLLEKHRVCWVWADTSPLNERNLAPFEFLPRTTDFIYLRLLGDYATKYDRDGRRVHRYGKLLWKREAALESWSLEIERHLAEVRSVWTFVNNHFEGFAPETCQRLANRLGFELPAARSEARRAAPSRIAASSIFLRADVATPCLTNLAPPRNTAAVFPESEPSRLAADPLRSSAANSRGSASPEPFNVCAESILPFRILETQVHPARLEIFEVRAARHFEIGVLPRRPDLDVVSFG